MKSVIDIHNDIYVYIIFILILVFEMFKKYKYKIMYVQKKNEKSLIKSSN